MAIQSWSTKHSVKNQLQSQPYRFSFVQACRLLEQICAIQGRPSKSVGCDALPTEEFIRFAALVSRSFPPSEVAKLTHLADPQEAEAVDSEAANKPTLTVSFMGLFGPSGVLPYHDTQRIIDAGNRKNPERDFLDVFNHRVISLFYRASTKYRIPFAFEATYQKSMENENVVTQALYALAGMGTPCLRKRLEVSDELSIEFAGLFGHQVKNAISLQRLLSDYFGLPVSIRQFVGQWMYLSKENQSYMPSRNMMLGQNCALGNSFILGERVWDVGGKFRVQIGPLTKAQFDSFLPGNPQLVKAAQITQLYAGNQFDFDIQLELIAQEVPPTQLGDTSRLGFNTWVFAEQPSDNKTDAVLVQSGLPLTPEAGRAA
jgi:type VI secretion system protein ImpH